MTAIEKAIKAVGGVTTLAGLLKSTPQTVVHWRKRGIPAKRVLDVERATGVSRYELRPDIYGKEVRA